MKPEAWAFIQKVFHDALHIEDNTKREQFINLQIPDKAQQEELRKLLQAHSESEKFLAEPLLDPFNHEQNQLSHLIKSKHNYLSGKRIGNYILQEEIGRGGMGIVYSAFQEKPLKRHVALKLLSVPTASADMIARFHREYHTLAQLKHPNIAQVYDAGMTEDNLPYFTMELVEGSNIKDFVKKKKIGQPQYLDLAIQVAEGLHHAHQKGVVHRDIKPTNIIVTNETTRPLCKIIDFGIAKSLFFETQKDEVSGAIEDNPNQTVGLLGSPLYLPPERLQKTDGIPDVRSDIYSYGVTLFELMSGEPPFKGLSSAEILDYKSQFIQPPHKSNQKLPKDLSLLIEFCMEIDLDRRPSSMVEVTEDLRRISRCEPIQSKDLGYIYRFRLFLARHRWLTATSFIFILLLLSIAAVLIRTKSQAKQTEFLIQELSTRVERLEWQRRVSHMLPIHNLQKDNKRLQEKMQQMEALGNQYGAMAFGPKYFALGKIEVSMRNWEEARKYLEKATTAASTFPEFDMTLGRTYAELYWAKMDELALVPLAASANLEQKAKLDYRAPAELILKKSDDPDAFFYRGILLELQGKDKEAIQSYKEAFKENPWQYEALLREAAIRTRQCQNFLDRGEHDKFQAVSPRLEELFLKLKQIAPSDPEVYTRFAAYLQAAIELEIRLGNGPDSDHDRLIQACGEALSIENNDYQALTFLASELWSFAEYNWYREGTDPRPDVEEALSWTQRAGDLKTGQLRHHFIASQAHCTLGYYKTEIGQDPMTNFKKAQRHIDAILYKFPSDFRSLHQMGLISWMIADYQMSIGSSPLMELEKSEHYYTMALDLKPGLSLFLNNLALVFDSRADYERLTQKDPTQSFLHSEKLYEKAIQIDGYRLAYGNLANLFIQQAFYLLKLNNENMDHVLELVQKAKEAILELDRINHKDSEVEATRAKIFLVLAKTKERLGQTPVPFYDNAISLLETELNNYPDAIDLKITLLSSKRMKTEWMLLHSNVTDASIKADLPQFQQFRDQFPEHSDVKAEYASFLILSRPQNMLKQLKMAKTMLEEAISANPLLNYEYGHYLE